ncbi:DESI1 [Symbiodinium necroappetens]|uniref:DESI1 protein n=1 Tax=Symbiodinium necroappetens TaxID=1628268 RepID=A0A813A1J1_9DINO|nr:DESI1 [Symbiodinium necroappetens]
MIGIWHTGVLAFGREYWFGGKVLASEPGKAPFPPGPIRCSDLGTTLHTKEELEDWLRFEVVPRYTRDNYDILSHNCNHFSDEVVGFLIQVIPVLDRAILVVLVCPRAATSRMKPDANQRLRRECTNRSFGV